jgi:Enoyl-(Acyl carrier protein) reductase
LIHYTQRLAYTLAPKGIRANSVSPGNTLFKGGFWGDLKDSDDTVYKEQLALNPTGRMATAEEIAKPTVFLARYVALAHVLQHATALVFLLQLAFSADTFSPFSILLTISAARPLRLRAGPTCA